MTRVDAIQNDIHSQQPTFACLPPLQTFTNAVAPETSVHETKTKIQLSQTHLKLNIDTIRTRLSRTRRAVSIEMQQSAISATRYGVLNALSWNARRLHI